MAIPQEYFLEEFAEYVRGVKICRKYKKLLTNKKAGVPYINPGEF